MTPSSQDELDALPDRAALARSLSGYISTWLASVQTQRERIPAAFREARPDQWADPLLYAYALRQLLRGCWATQQPDESGAIATAVEAFEAEVPSVRDVRNALDKFDEEEAARLGGLASYATYDDGFTSFMLHVGDYVLDIDAATEAARRMGNAVLAVLNTIC